MTLHDAIQQLLIDSKSELTSSQLAKLINDNKLYVRRDKKPVTASQVMSRVGNYPKLFKKNGNKISLKGFSELDLIEEEIKIDLKQLVNHLYHSNSIAKTNILPLILRTIIELDSNLGDLNNLERFFENISREIDSGRSIEFRSSSIFQHLYEVTLKIHKHPNRYRVLQKVIYWLNDSSRGSELMLLPEYLCSIIGSLEIYGENTFLLTTANMLNNFKLSISENYPDHNIDYNYSDEWTNNEVLKLDDLILRASGVHFTKRTNNPVKKIGVITPPWGVKVRNQQWSSNFSIIMEQIESYGKPFLDKALLIVPEGALFSGGKDHKARTILTENQFVKSIVTFPFKSNYTAIKSAVIILFDFEKPNENVLFADFNQLEKFDIEHDWQRVSALINSNDSAEEISTVVNTDLIVDNACMWLPNRYLLKSFSFEKKDGHETVSLKTVLENWNRGKNVPRKKLYEGGELKYVRTSDLPNEDIYLNINDKTLGLDFDEFEENVLPLKNSIVVTLIGNDIKSTVIPSNALFLFNPHIAVLKVNSNKILPEYLAWELREDYVKKQLDQYRKGTTVPTISLKDFLDEIVVQIPSLEQQKDILLSKDRAVKDNDKNELAFDYIATLKHTLKQQLKTLSSDLVSVTKFLSDLEKSKKSIQLDDIIVSVFPGEDVSKLSDYKLSKTLERMSRSLDNAHSSLDQAQNALEIESIKKTRFDIKELIEEIKSSHPNLEIKISGKKQEILADRGQIRMALNNIVNNAVKHGFNEENKPWEIGFRVDPQKTNDPLLIEITNNGRPFPSDFNSEEFLSKGGKTGNNQGTGFGGYLINKIIENHKGQIEIVPTKDIEFEKYNVKFIISLPKL